MASVAAQSSSLAMVYLPKRAEIPFLILFFVLVRLLLDLEESVSLFALVEDRNTKTPRDAEGMDHEAAYTCRAHQIVLDSGAERAMTSIS